MKHLEELVISYSSVVCVRTAYVYVSSPQESHFLVSRLRANVDAFPSFSFIILYALSILLLLLFGAHSLSLQFFQAANQKLNEELFLFYYFCAKEWWSGRGLLLLLAGCLCWCALVSLGSMRLCISYFPWCRAINKNVLAWILFNAVGAWCVCVPCVDCVPACFPTH